MLLTGGVMTARDERWSRGQGWGFAFKTREKAGWRPTTRDEDGQIVPGDVIVGVDGKRVKGTDDLFRIPAARGVGDILHLDIQRRNEGALQVEIQLQTLS